MDKGYFGRCNAFLPFFNEKWHILKGNFDCLTTYNLKMVTAMTLIWIVMNSRGLYLPTIENSGFYKVIQGQLNGLTKKHPKRT